MKDQKVTEPTADRPRSESDRRADDVRLPPVKIERRLIVERRLPSVDENAVSFSDWVKSMVFFLAKIRRRAKAKAVTKPAKPKKW